MIKFVLLALTFSALSFETFVEGKRPKGQRFFSEKNGCVSFCTKKSGAKRNSYENREKWVDSSSPKNTFLNEKDVIYHPVFKIKHTMLLD